LVVLYLRELSHAQIGLGQAAEAYNSLWTAYQLKDSLQEERRMELMEEMQARFEVLETENQLAGSRIELLERTKERNRLFGGFMLILLAGISVAAILRQRIVINRKLAFQRERLLNAEMEALEQRTNLENLKAMVEGEEKERLRVAADLHDGLGGLLASVKSHFSSVEKQNTVVWDRTGELIDEACSEVRRISHNMAPRTLMSMGLEGALTDLAQQIRQKGLQCDTDFHGLTSRGPMDEDPAIYRIIQELTHNVLKHADATNLFLQVISHPNQISILVEDDGKGFELAADLDFGMSRSGLGLGSVIRRAKFLGGEVHWDTAPGRGTTVTVTIPVKQPPKETMVH